MDACAASKTDLDHQSCPNQAGAADAVRTILMSIGENPEREGRRDTLVRGATAYGEL